MWNDANMQQFILQFLPSGAVLLWLDGADRRPAIIMADMDGDRIQEIVAAYRFQDRNGIIVLTNYCGYWYPLAYIEGNGYGITYLNAAPVTDGKTNDLIIGWQHGAIYSKLDMQKWTKQGFKSMLQEEVYFSKIEVANMPTKKGLDEKYEIALWTHDTGDAYIVEVYQWEDDKLRPYPAVYPFYFRKVAEFYKKQVIRMPEAAFYWYYLADAQEKAELYNEALKSVDMAIKLGMSYPSLKVLRKLRERILKNLRNATLLFPASYKTARETKWGYIDESGRFAIKPQYDSAMDFQENGLAIVTIGNQAAAIDRFGRFVIAPKYSTINPFNEGRATVIDEAGFKVIDESGKVLTPKAYTYIGMYKNGRAVVSDPTPQGSYLYGYLDLQGKEVIPIQYNTATDFKNGQALVQIKEKQFALIDLSGQRLHTYNFANVINFGNGRLAYQPEVNSKYGYIDVTGKVVLQPKYSMAMPFKRERAIVNLSEDITNQYGLIDKQGNFIIQPIYNDIMPLGEDRAAVGKAVNPDQPFQGSVYAIADMVSGKILTDFIYENISSYERGYLSVSDNNNTFFLDVTGKKAASLPTIKGSGTLSLTGNLIRANIDNRLSYYTRDGQLVYEQNTTIPLSNQYKIIEKKYAPDNNYFVYYPQLSGIRDEKVQNSINEQLKKLSLVVPIEDQKTRDYTYSGDFSVEFFKESLLVLELDGYQYYFGAAHGMPTKVYPNIDLVTGKFYELKDLFKPGSNYVAVLSDIIAQQIKNDPQYSYIFPDQYKGIAENQSYFVREDALYIYFSPYEIASYAAGFPTFRIPFTQIMSIINTEGAFWKAFH